LFQQTGLSQDCNLPSQPAGELNGVVKSVRAARRQFRAAITSASKIREPTDFLSAFDCFVAASAEGDYDTH
jgi:hypothetical protein